MRWEMNIVCWNVAHLLGASVSRCAFCIACYRIAMRTGDPEARAVPLRFTRTHFIGDGHLSVTCMFLTDQFDHHGWQKIRITECIMFKDI